MQREVVIAVAQDNNDLQEILKLQQLNLPKNISPEDAIKEGFVTVEHSFEVLKRMNDAHPHAIAKHNNEVVGYALVMTRDFRNDIPVLIPMFEMIDQLIFEDSPLSHQNCFVMGQICIARDFRGLGLFDLLYEKLRQQLVSSFSFCVTEVASRNTRSIKAHQRVGFETIHVYNDPRGEKWEIMLWKW